MFIYFQLFIYLLSQTRRHNIVSAIVYFANMCFTKQTAFINRPQIPKLRFGRPVTLLGGSARLVESQVTNPTDHSFYDMFGEHVVPQMQLGNPRSRFLGGTVSQ